MNLSEKIEILKNQYEVIEELVQEIKENLSEDEQK